MNQQQPCGMNRRGRHAHRGAHAPMSRPMGRGQAREQGHEGDSEMVKVTIIVNESGMGRGPRRHGANRRAMGRDDWRQGHAGRRHRDHGLHGHAAWGYEGDEHGPRHGRRHHRPEMEYDRPDSRLPDWRAEGGRVVGRVIEMPDGSTRIIPKSNRA